MHRLWNRAAVTLAAGRPRRRTLVALITAATAITTGGPAPGPAAAQTLPTTTVTQALSQILELQGGVNPRKLKMIEEEGYLCVLAFHPVPAGISWVCVPPLQ